MALHHGSNKLPSALGTGSLNPEPGRRPVCLPLEIAVSLWLRNVQAGMGRNNSVTVLGCGISYMIPIVTSAISKTCCILAPEAILKLCICGQVNYNDQIGLHLGPSSKVGTNNIVDSFILILCIDSFISLLPFALLLCFLSLYVPIPPLLGEHSACALCISFSLLL